MTEQLKQTEKLATQRFRGKKLSKQGKKQDKGFSPHSSQDKKQRGPACQGKHESGRGSARGLERLWSGVGVGAWDGLRERA